MLIGIIQVITTGFNYADINKERLLFSEKKYTFIVKKYWIKKESQKNLEAMSPLI